MVVYICETRKDELLSKFLFEMTRIKIQGKGRKEKVRYFMGSYSFSLNRPLSQMQN